MEVFHYAIGVKIPGTSYRVIDRLAAGGMGAVYEVLDENLDKRLILKTIIASLAKRDDLVARIRREAKALAKLTHPNIVQIFRFDQTEDSLRIPYLVMERLEGESLRSYLERDGVMPWREATEIIVEILGALAHSHTHGIVHRDVKPENIFLHHDHAGRAMAKLIDFGIVSVPNPETQRLTSDRFIGTLGYAAPEQLLGEPATPLVDVYATGLVFYEMVTGKNPFDELDVVASLARARVERVPDRMEVEGLPEELRALILASFRNDRGLRPASAADFAARIRKIVPGSETGKVSLPPEGSAITQSGTTGSEWTNRASIRLMACVLGLGVLLGGVVPIAKKVIRDRKRAAAITRELEHPKEAENMPDVAPSVVPSAMPSAAAPLLPSSIAALPSATLPSATLPSATSARPASSSTPLRAVRHDGPKGKTRLPGAGL